MIFWDTIADESMGRSKPPLITSLTGRSATFSHRRLFRRRVKIAIPFWRNDTKQSRSYYDLSDLTDKSHVGGSLGEYHCKRNGFGSCAGISCVRAQNPGAECVNEMGAETNIFVQHFLRLGALKKAPQRRSSE